MPLKRTRSEFTGIFNQDIFEAHADDIEALRKMQRGEDRFWDFETLLQDIETEASQIWFKHCGFTPSSWSVLSPDEAESVTQDAGWVIHHIRRLRERVEVGDAKKAAVSAIHLGLAFGRMRVRPHEPNALSGYKAAIGARHGHEKTHGTKEDKIRRWAQYQKAVDDFKARIRDPRRHYIARTIAKRFGVSTTTIYKRTTLGQQPQAKSRTEFPGPIPSPKKSSRN